MRGARALIAFGTLVLAAGPALADDPHDRMSAEDIARDRAIIRKLNNDQLQYVRKRDAQYAAEWKDYDRARGGNDYADEDANGDAEDAPRGGSYARQSREYDRARRDYEADLARWRRDVAACRAGDYSRCER
ncbi:hypothetical protein [Novosphingobium sp. ST904]|uniref:hypothetical protein n=1 Tax=Novosphingobium sp. ST904 TaxID=1684385 RepID=UPI0006C857A2|nr:hypothetical protein [Novosphingobium sp. ST904]KPH64832.1 hypothetical protein ADT71_11115 [Novosphingobium sp. ST904]TCM34492.1 hypothetical protein EDF59_11752 [Novosphingobium sp. ST904]